MLEPFVLASPAALLIAAGGNSVQDDIDGDATPAQEKVKQLRGNVPATTLAFFCVGVLFLPSASRADTLNPLSFASDGTLVLSAGTYTINTGATAGASPQLLDSSGSVLFTGAIFNQGGVFDPTVGVFDFESILINAGVTINVVGANPLALLSQTTTVVGGQIFANGEPCQNADGNSPGAGGAGVAGGGNGGTGGSPCQGAAGSGPGGGPPDIYCGLSDEFGVGGGYGGAGVDGGIGCCESATYGDLNALLLAGSGGGGSSQTFDGPGGGGGGGGGAIEFAAGQSIEVLGTGGVYANGGTQGRGEGAFGYPAGGGSGGGIIFAAPTVTLDDPHIEADGGGYDGGGGRIMFSTSTGTIVGGSAFLTAGADEGFAGVISYSVLDDGSPSPEPGTHALLFAGLGAFGVQLRRRGEEGKGWRPRRSSQVVAPSRAPDNGTVGAAGRGCWRAIESRILELPKQLVVALFYGPPRGPGCAKVTA